uniref:Uncharacterized protein n=1 Tax=Myotis myotis TaxID=51298 RepID=A0A7J7Y175_MYOMY|nr:hypothetical protein mMyoMyo1_011490 [Myotis myotis]
MQELPPCGQCAPTAGALLSQKLGSWLASPAIAAALRSSEQVGGKERGVPDCERAQAGLRDHSSSARISCTRPLVLSKSAESGHPCLVLDFRGKAFRFSLLSIMLAEGLPYMAFIMLKYFPSIPILLSVLIINECCILSNAFSASIDKIICFLPFLMECGVLP